MDPYAIENIINILLSDNTTYMQYLLSTNEQYDMINCQNCTKWQNGLVKHTFLKKTKLVTHLITNHAQRNTTSLTESNITLSYEVRIVNNSPLHRCCESTFETAPWKPQRHNKKCKIMYTIKLIK